MSLVEQDLWAPAPNTLSLSNDDTHVWRAWLDRSPAETGTFHALLSADEQERAARFHFEHDRRRFIVARGLLRTILARYLACEAQEVRFDYGDNGKPFLHPHHDNAGLQFNLAHSHQMALYAIALQRAVGVDVEYKRRLTDGGKIAHRFFSPDEAKLVVDAAPGEQQQAFFQIWTRKEAYIKAIGLGLAQPLAEFEVAQPQVGPLSFVHLVKRPEAEDRWRIVDLDPHPEYAAALVVEGEQYRLSRWRAA
jgi:4'-phosphopantetheinyl transferase